MSKKEDSRDKEENNDGRLSWEKKMSSQENIYIGYSTGKDITSGSDSTLIGRAVGQPESNSKRIFELEQDIEVLKARLDKAPSLFKYKVLEKMNKVLEQRIRQLEDETN